MLAESVGSMAMSWAELPLVVKFLVAARTSSSSSSASSPKESSLKFLKGRDEGMRPLGNASFIDLLFDNKNKSSIT